MTTMKEHLSGPMQSWVCHCSAIIEDEFDRLAVPPSPSLCRLSFGMRFGLQTTEAEIRQAVRDHVAARAKWVKAVSPQQETP